MSVKIFSELLFWLMLAYFPGCNRHVLSSALAVEVGRI